MLAETVGLCAAALTTISFLPQAIRVLRTRDTAAISLWMYALFVAGVVCWEIYGLMIGSRPVIIANLITLALASIILAQKIMDVAQTKKARP